MGITRSTADGDRATNTPTVVLICECTNDTHHNMEGPQMDTPVGTPKPVTARAGGPYRCKACPPKHYFGIRVETGQTVPVCPNCKKRIEAVTR